MAATTRIAENTIPASQPYGAPSKGRTRFDQVNELASDENFAEILLPKNVTAVIATMAMKATRIPYSASAAPSSFLIKRRAASAMRVTSASVSMNL